MQKKVLVTGASSGLGEAIALKLAKEGDFVYAGARKTDDIKKLSEKKNTIGVRLDITKPAQIQAAKQKIMAKTPELQNPLDVIVNNAGVAIGGPLVEFNEEKLKHEFDVNVFGAFRITKAFFPLLQKSINEPRIINISSTAGKHALPFFGPYAMSKYALEAYSDSLRRELDPLGIKVVIVEPGKVKTEIWKKAQQQLDNFEHSMFRERALP